MGGTNRRAARFVEPSILYLRSSFFGPVSSDLTENRAQQLAFGEQISSLRLTPRCDWNNLLKKESVHISLFFLNNEQIVKIHYFGSSRSSVISVYAEKQIEKIHYTWKCTVPLPLMDLKS